MIPTSSKTIERKRRILTAGTVLKRCFKGTIVPAFLHIQATVFNGCTGIFKLSPFISIDSNPVWSI
jgi:hypothetical protein